MMFRSFVALLTAMTVLLAALGSRAVAGTTGTLTGQVTDGRRAPVAGARVTVSSPAQQEQTTTDARGRFTFISLFPNAYSITISKTGFGTQRVGVVAVTADGSTSVVLRVARLFWILDEGRMVRPAATLIRPGTVADEYVIPSTWPLYDAAGNVTYALRFIPGLTFGAGPALQF